MDRKRWVPVAIGLVPLLVTVAMLALPEVALARAGGGGHGGGGGSGGFGGGGFGGGGGGFFFLPFLFGGGGGFTFFLIAAYIAYRIFMATRGGRGGLMGNQPVDYYQPPAAGDTSGLADIKANDPGFDEEQFLGRCQAAFFLLQQAWMDRNVDEGRAYMSPGLYTSWRAQVDAMTAAHKKNVLENLYIQGLHVVKASHDLNFDRVTVKVDASATDYEVDDQTGKQVFAVGGSKADRPFTEYWTFQRSAGAKTLVTGGITEKKCPNCGAPLEVNATGECKYCNAAVTSGQFDWVLARIDQANEYQG